MRSLLLFALLSLGLAACVDVHNPPPPEHATVVVPPAPATTTTVICPAGSVSC